MRGHTSRIIRVIATPSTACLHPDDMNKEGEYLVEVDADLPNAKAASIALDVFHDTVPIRVLDDFVFSVVDSSGQRLDEDDRHIAYSGTSAGHFLGAA